MGPRARPIAVASAPRARTRVAHASSHKTHVDGAPPLHPAMSPASPTAPVELLSDDEGHLLLPIRFQCPLCFDVLRSPIELPCCHRHLCRECFERALEITSANCGFCRKRIVGLARTKQYHVDDVLWTEIRRCCPFVAHTDTDGASDCVVDIEFVDENAPPKWHHAVDSSASSSTVTVREPEVPPPSQAIPVTPASRPRSASADPKAKLQHRLDAFFAGTLPSPPAPSRPSSAGSVRSLRSTTSSNSSSSSTKSRRRVEMVGKKAAVEATKPRLRSASHSPKARAPAAVQRTLLQLTLRSPTAATTTSRVMTRQSSLKDKEKGSTIVTRPRRPWRCRHCTFENNCFATSCSMCHQYPASTH